MKEEQIALGGLIAWFAIVAAWWALALWPVGDAPGWLERTRYVCFGINATGLPDGGGWIGLIGGPIGMLLILVTGWSGAFRSLVRRGSRPVRVTLIAIVCGLLLIAGGASWRVLHAEAVSFDPTSDARDPAAYPRMNKDAPALELVAQDGRRLRLDALAGKPVLITFAYAHCETVCPLVVNHVLRAQQLLHEKGKVARVVIVTLDPWRDTPARLPGMAATWRLPPSDAWVLSGPVAEVERTLDTWQVPRTQDHRTGDITHVSTVYVIDRKGRIAFAATGGAELLAGLAERL